MYARDIQKMKIYEQWQKTTALPNIQLQVNNYQLSDIVYLALNS